MPRSLLLLVNLLIAIEICLAIGTPKRCTLDATQIEDMKRVYLTRPNGQWELLHYDFVPVDEALYLFCDATHYDVAQCTGSGSFNITLPLGSGSCPTPMRATVQKFVDGECQVLKGTAYRVGYQVGNSFLEIYRTCYDLTAVRAYYTRHTVYPFSVTASNFKRPDFATDSLITAASRGSFKSVNVYPRFGQLLGLTQTYITNGRDAKVERGHLAPSGDFLSYDQMRETFKYINVVPQFRGPNRSNWKRIEFWIKNLARSANTPVEVLTGAYEVLELPHSQAPHQLVRIYLEQNSSNPMPKWLYKVVRNGNVCHVLVVHNSQFVQPNQLPTALCTPAVGPSGLSFHTDLAAGYAYCCNYASFITVVGSHADIC